jgi:hypothetical protein
MVLNFNTFIIKIAKSINHCDKEYRKRSDHGGCPQKGVFMALLKQFLSSLGYFLFEQGTLVKKIAPHCSKNGERLSGSNGHFLANMTTMNNF